MKNNIIDGCYNIIKDLYKKHGEQEHRSAGILELLGKLKQGNNAVTKLKINYHKSIIIYIALMLLLILPLFLEKYYLNLLIIFGIFVIINTKIPPKYVAIPFVISLGGFLAAYNGIYEDIGLIILGIWGTILIIKRNSQIERKDLKVTLQ